LTLRTRAKIVALLLLERRSGLLGTLFEQQKNGECFPRYACLPFNSANRFEWFYLPASFIHREGLPLKSMNSAQQAAALDLLKTSLSVDGATRAGYIRMLEPVLAVPASTRQRAGHRTTTDCRPTQASTGHTRCARKAAQDLRLLSF